MMVKRQWHWRVRDPKSNHYKVFSCPNSQRIVLLILFERPQNGTDYIDCQWSYPSQGLIVLRFQEILAMLPP